MRKKIWLAMTFVFFMLGLFDYSSVFGHTVAPGAIVIGVVGPQPDEANLNDEGIAWVVGGTVNVLPFHNSEMIHLEYLLEGNSRAYARLRTVEGRIIAFKQLIGSTQYFTLETWEKVSSMQLTIVVLEIGYVGQRKEMVPKVKIFPRIEKIMIYSHGHGGIQELYLISDVLPDPNNLTITLK